MFVGLVMTEAIAYLAAAWVLLAIMLALERPTPLRQISVLVGAVVAYTARPQLGALYGTYLLGLALVWLIMPSRFPRSREALRAYWPTAGSLALAAAVFAAPLIGGESPLGAYEVLWRSYDPLVVGKWFLYHLADLELYLAVLPVAVAPIVLAALVRRGRRESSAAEAAFAALFLAANAVGLAVVAVFASTEHGFDRLHDRNIFYLVPLWLAVVALWLAWGLPRPLVATAAGAALALGLAAFLPFEYISAEVGVDVVPSALWARVQELADGYGRRVLALGVVLAGARRGFPPAEALARLPGRRRRRPRRHRRTRVGPPDRRAGERRVRGRRVQPLVDRRGAARRRTRDEAVLRRRRLPGHRDVTRHALYLTEFFNGRVKTAAYVDDSVPTGSRSRR